MLDALAEHDLFKNQFNGSLTTMNQLIGIYKKSLDKKKALTEIYKYTVGKLESYDKNEVANDLANLQIAMIKFS